MGASVAENIDPKLKDAFAKLALAVGVQGAAIEGLMAVVLKTDDPQGITQLQRIQKIVDSSAEDAVNALMAVLGTDAKNG